MKSRTLYACLIAMFLLSSVTFGDIVTTGGGDDWTDSHANASASGSNPLKIDDESGWEYIYTTESGYFDWSIGATAYAYGSVTISGGTASALAIGDAESIGPDSTVSAYAAVDITSGEDEDDPPGDYDNDNDHFDAYYGVSGDHVALAIASVEEGTGSSATCNSSAAIHNSLG